MNSSWMRRACGVMALALMVGVLPRAALAQSVRVTTDMGAFTIELQPDRAPLTVANFLRYVNEGFYSGTLIHRVVSGFVVQGGGHAATDYRLKPTHDPVINESGNGLQNKRSWVGMARSGSPHSGNSQFYVNIADNPELDPLPTRWGYAVFGKVTDGMDVLDKIGVVATGSMGPFKSEAPLKPVVIEKVELVNATSRGPGSAVNRAVMPSSEGAAPPAAAPPPTAAPPPATPPAGATSPGSTQSGGTPPAGATPPPK